MRARGLRGVHLSFAASLPSRGFTYNFHRLESLLCSRCITSPLPPFAITNSRWSPLLRSNAGLFPPFSRCNGSSWWRGKKNKCLWTVEKTGSLRWRGIRTTRRWLLWVSGENRKEKRKLSISSIDDPIFLICHPVSSQDTRVFWVVVNRILFLIRAEVGERHERIIVWKRSVKD